MCSLCDSQGIGRGLIQKATEVARAEGLKNFLFTASRMSPELQQYLAERQNSYWYRTDETDWSVLRINFNGSERKANEVQQRGY